jgi:hypothetical protein
MEKYRVMRENLRASEGELSNAGSRKNFWKT